MGPALWSHIRGPSTELDIEASYGAHCECIILQHLKDADWFCWRLKAFLSIVSRIFRCNGCGSSYAWVLRSVGEVAVPSTELRRLFGVKLQAIVKEKLDSSAIKHARSLYQSTYPSEAADLPGKVFRNGQTLFLMSHFADNTHVVAQMRNEFMADYGSPSAWTCFSFIQDT